MENLEKRITVGQEKFDKFYANLCRKKNHTLKKFSSLMFFLLHKFAHFFHDLRLFKALRLFFLTNFPGPTVIPCPTSIPDSRVYRSLKQKKNKGI